MTMLTRAAFGAVLACATLSGAVSAQEANALRGLRQVHLIALVDANEAEQRACQIPPELGQRLFDQLRAAIAAAGLGVSAGSTVERDATGSVTVLGSPVAGAPTLGGMIVVDRDGEPEQCVAILELQLSMRVPGVRITPNGEALNRRLIFWSGSDAVVSPARGFAGKIEDHMVAAGQSFVRQWRRDNPR